MFEVLLVGNVMLLGHYDNDPFIKNVVTRSALGQLTLKLFVRLSTLYCQKYWDTPPDN